MKKSLKPDCRGFPTVNLAFIKPVTNKERELIAIANTFAAHLKMEIVMMGRKSLGKMKTELIIQTMCVQEKYLNKFGKDAKCKHQM